MGHHAFKPLQNPGIHELLTEGRVAAEQNTQMLYRLSVPRKGDPGQGAVSKEGVSQTKLETTCLCWLDLCCGCQAEKADGSLHDSAGSLPVGDMHSEIISMLVCEGSVASKGKWDALQ